MSILNNIAVGNLRSDNALLRQELITADAKLKSDIESDKNESRKNLAALENNLRDKAATADLEAMGKSLLYDIGGLLKSNALLKQEMMTADVKLKSDIESNKNESRKNLAALENNLRDKAATADLDAMGKTNKQELARLENKIFQPSEIYEKARKSVVGIYSGDSAGTGFIFGKKNQVITAYHVVKAGPGTTVSITPNDGHLWIQGKIIKVKPEWDLAVIELAEPLNAEPLMPADAKKLSIGDPIVAIGNPAMLNNSVSAGIISAFDRHFDNYSIQFIQIDNSVYFGNSGGPILNKQGEVIGVVSRSIGAFTFSFAVPINYVELLLEE
ncbi:MAG: serine protease [Candidatus Nealsonbacteria bacterium]|nr:serine protease [Candidatus Nealsonbacteria bacterium]